jgi:hypothetical protein
VHVHMARRHLNHHARNNTNRYPLRAMCICPYLS